MTHRCCLMRAIATALELPKDFFDDKFSNPSSWMAMWYYPANPSAEDSWGVGPHTDHEVLTIISQDDVGGLEFQTRDGKWMDVPPIPGKLIVDLLHSSPLIRPLYSLCKKAV